MSMQTTNWTLPLMLAALSSGLACSSEPGSAPGSTSGGSSAGASGSAGMTATGGSAGASGAGGGSGTSGTGGVSGAGGTAGAAGSAGTAGSAGSAGGTGLPSTEPFSFFVASLAALTELSQEFYQTDSELGFGGDLTYGETGPGAGLRGADKICTAIAERSMPGNNKTWRAFLSVTADAAGSPVNAIDRVGDGPWYDRLGRLVANTKTDLQNNRPMGADAAIINDLPNEDGVPNNQPDPNQEEVDNHDTLTGSNEDGLLATEDMGDTCNDWTSSEGEIGAPRIGHSWPRDAGGGDDVQSWISEHEAGGCAPGVNLFGEGGPQPGDYSVGAGGGYGGIYCFSLDP
jgi:hypothetical protein